MSHAVGARQQGLMNMESHKSRGSDTKPKAYLAPPAFARQRGGPLSDIYKGRISAHRGRLPHAGTVRHYVREKSGFLRDWPRGLQNVRFHGAKRKKPIFVQKTRFVRQRGGATASLPLSKT